MNLDCADSVAEALALRPGSSGSMSECRAAPGEHRKAHDRKGADRGRPGRLGHDRTAAGWIGPLAGLEKRLAAPGLGCACMRQIAATRRTRTGTDMGRISGQSWEHSLIWEHYIQLSH